MTPKEAIQRILRHTEVHRRKEPNAIFITKALQIAIVALEKQIPTKPIKKNPICYEKSKDGEERYAYDYYCPQCGVTVNHEKHHCPCGQALDWSGSDG